MIITHDHYYDIFGYYRGSYVLYIYEHVYKLHPVFEHFPFFDSTNKKCINLPLSNQAYSLLYLFLNNILYIYAKKLIFSC